MKKIRRACGKVKPCENVGGVSEPKKIYRWPWFVAAAVLLGIGLAILFMFVAVKKAEQQRDFTPLPASTPMR